MSKSFEFGMISPLDESISCILIRVDPWVHALTFRGLHALTFRGLHVLAFRGLLVLTFRGLHTLTFRGLHVLAIKGLHALTFRGLHVLAIKGLHVLTIKGLRALAFRVLHVLRELHALTFRGLHVLAFRGLRILTFRGLHICALREFKYFPLSVLFPGPPLDLTGGPTVRGQSEKGYRVATVHTGARDCARKTPSEPGEAQQGPGVSSSGYGPLLVLQGITPARHPVDPEKSNRVLGFPALITGLYQFYRVLITPNKVIRPLTNRAFIKKYYAPQASARRNTTAAWGWPATGNKCTAATSRAPQLIHKKVRVLPTTHGRPISDQVQSQRSKSLAFVSRPIISVILTLESRDMRRYPSGCPHFQNFLLLSVRQKA
ncbi:Dynein heavy chain [Glycine soja]